jgi:hypothetical protein
MTNPGSSSNAKPQPYAAQHQAMQQSPNFGALPQPLRQTLTGALDRAPNQQAAVAIQSAAVSDALRHASANGAPGQVPAQQRQQNIETAVSDRRFPNLSSDLQRYVVESASLGRANASDLVDRASFTPGTGIRVNGSSQDQASFNAMMQRTMVRDDNFGQLVTDQNSRRRSVTMNLVRNDPNTFVDATLPNRGGREQGRYTGTHRVDVGQIEAFPRSPGHAPEPDRTTQDQNVIHVVREATEESRGAPYSQAHQRAIQSENAYRRSVGQNGESVDCSLTNTGATFHYRNGHQDENITVKNGKITGIK